MSAALSGATQRELTKVGHDKVVVANELETICSFTHPAVSEQHYDIFRVVFLKQTSNIRRSFSCFLGDYLKTADGNQSDGSFKWKQTIKLWEIKPKPKLKDV